MAFIDRRVHKTVADFLRYLQQTMPVVQSSVLVNAREHTMELASLDSVVEGDVLVLKMRGEEWYPQPTGQ